MFAQARNTLCLAPDESVNAYFEIARDGIPSRLPLPRTIDCPDVSELPFPDPLSCTIDRLPVKYFWAARSHARAKRKANGGPIGIFTVAISSARCNRIECKCRADVFIAEKILGYPARDRNRFILSGALLLYGVLRKHALRKYSTVLTVAYNVERKS